MIFTMFKILLKINKLIFLVRGKCLSIFLKFCGCKIGNGLKCRQWPYFRQLPHNNILLGNNVTIGKRVTFDVHSHGMLIINDNVNLTQDIVISSYERVSIGKYSLIGEYVSIRDADHGTRPDEYIYKQELKASAIHIGDDVWLAAGCRILKGAMIPTGSIIAANAVVTNKTFLEKTISQGVYAGVPAVFKKLRS